ncbi:MAG: hypothetical protein ACJAYU_002337 [Bradymonadia bacterium]
MGLALVAVPSAAFADVSLLDKNNGTLTVGGYARTALMVQDSHRLGLSELINPEPTSGQSVGVVRLEWTSSIGERVTLDIHQRLSWRTPQTSGLAAQLGLGATAEPVRTVDLSTNIVSDESLLLAHDIDRLAARLYLNRVDLYIGRQAITWGNALMLPSTDLWSRFAQFELDTTEKPGVDAVRALAGVSDSTELEFVIVDRGAAEDVSGGVRATVYLDRSDVYVYAAKHWDALGVGGGFARDLDTVSLRLDVHQPVPLAFDERDTAPLPRATLGVDHFRSKWNVSGELHFNGAGAGDSDEYVQSAIESPEYERGEIQLLGTAYAGILWGYRPVEPISFSLLGLVNLLDPSAVLAPSMMWTPMQDVELGIGGYIPIGAAPNTSGLLPQARSEFGNLPNSVYFQMAAYY